MELLLEVMPVVLVALPLLPLLLLVAEAGPLRLGRWLASTMSSWYRQAGYKMKHEGMRWGGRIAA